MTPHLRRWGWVWLLAAMWAAAWAAQLIVQAVAGDPPADMAVATLENWQSEFLQLVVQALLLIGAADVAFRRATEDQHRMERKLDAILTELDVDPGDFR